MLVHLPVFSLKLECCSQEDKKSQSHEHYNVNSPQAPGSSHCATTGKQFSQVLPASLQRFLIREETCKIETIWENQEKRGQGLNRLLQRKITLFYYTAFRKQKTVEWKLLRIPLILISQDKLQQRTQGSAQVAWSGAPKRFPSWVNSRNPINAWS